MAEDNDKDIIKKSEENLRKATEDLQEKTAKISDKGKSSEIVKKTKEGALAMLRKPIIIILIIVAILLIIFLYTDNYALVTSHIISRIMKHFGINP